MEKVAPKRISPYAMYCSPIFGLTECIKNNTQGCFLSRNQYPELYSEAH